MRLFDSLSGKHACYPTVVNITNPTSQSMKGRYFLGQTEKIELERNYRAYGALFNPPHSNRNLYLEVFTVSNFSCDPIVAGVWFNATLPGSPLISNHVTNANTTIVPPPEPQGQILYADGLCEFTPGGVEAFERIVPPGTTLADEKEGRYILGPGKLLLISLSATGRTCAEAIVAFGWWEEPVCPHPIR